MGRISSITGRTNSIKGSSNNIKYEAIELPRKRDNSIIDNPIIKEEKL